EQVRAPGHSPSAADFLGESCERQRIWSHRSQSGRSSELIKRRLSFGEIWPNSLESLLASRAPDGGSVLGMFGWCRGRCGRGRKGVPSASRDPNWSLRRKAQFEFFFPSKRTSSEVLVLETLLSIRSMPWLLLAMVVLLIPAGSHAQVVGI